MIVKEPEARAVILGAAGLVVFGRIAHAGGLRIQALVAREREFLADAAAVQFTRNPASIGGALRKLRDCESGGLVTAGAADAARHLFFADARGEDDLLSRWLPLRVHPSVEERLRRIEAASVEEARESEETDDPDETELAGASVSPEALVQRAGTLSAEALAEAEALRASVPTSVLEAAHEPLGAVALSYALMLDADDEERARQLDLLWEKETGFVYDETKHLYPEIASLDRPLRLPLAEVAAPSLRDLSADQRERCRDTMRALAEADDRITLFEFALEATIRHYLDAIGAEGAGEKSGAGLPSAAEAIRVLLSGMAQAAHADRERRAEAFGAGYDPLMEHRDLRPARADAARPDALHEALDRLSREERDLREEVLQACVRCARADEIVREQEMLLLRAVAAALGIPLPIGLLTREEDGEDPSAPGEERQAGA